MADQHLSLPKRSRSGQTVPDSRASKPEVTVQEKQSKPQNTPHLPLPSTQQGVGRHTIMTPLTYFAVSPEGIKFETQDEKEQVVLFLRQHLIFLFPSALLVLFLSFAPFILIPLFIQYTPLPIALPPTYYLVGTCFWYVMVFGVALTSFLRWFYNIYIVTDRRIVDIDFIHLLYKEFTEARLEKIQDITFKSGGIFAAFFDYGDVYVVTAGESPNIEFMSVPKPAQVVEAISDLLEAKKEANGV